MFPSVEEAVQNGISWLDKNGPSDWRQKINVEEISFPSMETCVLGQIYGVKCWPLGTTKINLSIYGFNSYSKYFDFDDLNRAWKEALSD